MERHVKQAVETICSPKQLETDVSCMSPFKVKRDDSGVFDVTPSPVQTPENRSSPFSRRDSGHGTPTSVSRDTSTHSVGTLCVLAEETFSEERLENNSADFVCSDNALRTNQSLERCIDKLTDSSQLTESHNSSKSQYGSLLYINPREDSTQANDVMAEVQDFHSNVLSTHIHSTPDCHHPEASSHISQMSRFETSMEKSTLYERPLAEDHSIESIIHHVNIVATILLVISKLFTVEYMYWCPHI